MTSNERLSEYVQLVSDYLEKKDVTNIKSISEITDSLIGALELDKKVLIEKFVSIVGEEFVNRLKTSDEERYFGIVQMICLSSIAYLNSMGDPLYFVAQMSFATDWFLYQSLNI